MVFKVMTNKGILVLKIVTKIKSYVYSKIV